MKELMKYHVRELRQNSTDTENHIWYYLRAKRLKGYKFRRQHLIYPYVVDFVCLKKKLIIELDGVQHKEQKQDDEERSLFLRSKGYKILRFWNNQALCQTEKVLIEILNALNE